MAEVIDTLKTVSDSIVSAPAISTDSIMSSIGTTAATVSEMASSIDTVWVLVAAALVFWMQAGFALVEAGFTRSKNTVNILMKNLIDFAFGSMAFFLVGYSLMFGANNGFWGIFGTYNDSIWTGAIPSEAFLIFQTVFAATAATIVSGAMAERTHFVSYVIFSIVISMLIYPISGHWIWGGGWLAQMGFVDFAGSTAVHSLGGWIGLAGAVILGPRIGKFRGKKVMAIPGHNLTFGALGVFILWLGWFGFNPGSQLAASGSGNAVAISHIFLTTNLAAAAGTIVTLVLTWILYGKPSLSVTLNGALAGLVAITAGCAAVDAWGAIIIGALAAIVLVFGLRLIENVFKVDDPVGAVTVHGLNGAFGTLMVGLFSTSSGALYGFGFDQFITQLIGVVAVAAWGLGTGFILFTILKKTIGLRVHKRVEEEGLDIYEHGETAYN
ncbi:MAG: ammonium transporter [Paludibacter sp.]|jgi:Amt family ammonium transporter|nr:ammonium transporter [Paludibacter sp.]